jgi:transposase-like protein
LKKVTADLKPIYKAATEEAALVELDRFEEVWGTKYPLIVRSWRNNWDELATFFKYPPEIRKLIYTTNIIESYHRQLRKVTKGKSIFPSDEALLQNALSFHHGRRPQMDRPRPKLGTDAAPAVGFLSGPGKPALTIKGLFPSPGERLNEFTQNS